MSTRLALRIQERYEKLAPSERRLAALVLEREDEILTYSATELAEMAGVSKATAARLFRSLGYSDFNEVRLQAREERNRTAPFSRSKAPDARVTASHSIGSHLQLELANLTRTFEELGSDRLELAGELLHEAPRVWLLAMGLEEGIARYGRLLLSRARPDVQVLGGQPGAIAEDLAMTGPRDALVLLVLSPRARALRPIIDYARTTRMNVITLTDPRGRLAAQRFSRVVVPCHVASHGLGPSHTALVSALRLMALALEVRSGAPATRRADLITEIHEELEDLE